ncbi:hypothetical protein ACTVZO_00240 [Streptomyces sp. IBSNAI002]|uniref:hypothetical protein n=1 Tax=Streptomyces sp. IBSNAI002 TaxID=3457500 RepID=UPI003FD23247
MNFSTKLAMTLPSVILATAFAAGPVFAADTPQPQPAPPTSSHWVGGDQQNGHGAIHMGSGSGHVLGSISHTVVVGDNLCGPGWHSVPSSTPPYYACVPGN